jgi:hypothetical protein
MALKNYKTTRNSRIQALLVGLLAVLAAPPVMWAQITAPAAAPANLVAKPAACGQVELSWIPSPSQAGSSGVYAYAVQRWENGNLLDETIVGASQTTFSDTNRLTRSTALTYSVVGIDRLGNRSATSNVETVGIAPCSNLANARFNGDFSGELEVLVEDGQQGSRTLYNLKTAKERLALQFAGNPPRGVVTGAHAHIKGVLADGAVTVAAGDAGVEVLADLSGAANVGSMNTNVNNGQFAVNTFGEQKTLVMLVNFQNDPSNRPWTLNQAHSVYDSVSSFYLENSYNQTWLTTDVVGWYIVPLDNSDCNNVSSVPNYANAAATSAGVNLAAYTHYVYVMPWVNCT